MFITPAHSLTLHSIQYTDRRMNVSQQELLLTITAHYTDWSHPAKHPLTIRQLTLEAVQDASLVAPSVTTAVRLTAPQRSTYFYVLEAAQTDQVTLLYTLLKYIFTDIYYTRKKRNYTTGIKISLALLNLASFQFEMSSRDTQIHLSLYFL